MDPIHKDHCEKCFKLNCNFDQCKLFYCNQIGCNFRMHECKIKDHYLICLRVYGPCINSEFGCSSIVLRDDLKNHLARCPASVINCPFEYNRWPAYTRKESLSKNNQLNYRDNIKDNLNIALAYHDQEMLNELYIDKKATRLFRNNLTRKYPAVPIRPSYLTGNKLSNNKEDQQLIDLSEDSSSLIKSNSLTKCSSFVSTISQTTSTISDEDDSIHDSPWPKSPPGLKKSVCEKLKNVTENKELINSNSFSRQEKTTDSSSSSANEDSGSCKVKKSKKKTKYKNPAKLENLILDLNIEIFANHQMKPKQMYTFRCNQNFRRDHFARHYRNVHSDIMTCLDEYMEKRCPNFQYRCPFFIRRLHPIFNGHKTKIIFSQLNKSFGHLVEPTNKLNNQSNIEINPDQLNLTDLPIEIINKIISYLDPFSLNNFSLTNKFMRILCSGHLESKGLVSLIWRKVKHTNVKTDNSKKKDASWIISGYQWQFSNSFDLIEQWKFDNDSELLNHLTNCEYFDRVIKKEPFALVGMTKN